MLPLTPVTHGEHSDLLFDVTHVICEQNMIRYLPRRAKYPNVERFGENKIFRRVGLAGV